MERWKEKEALGREQENILSVILSVILRVILSVTPSVIMSDILSVILRVILSVILNHSEMNRSEMESGGWNSENNITSWSRLSSLNWTDIEMTRNGPGPGPGLELDNSN